MFILGVVATKVKPDIKFVGGYSIGYIGLTTDKIISLENLTGGLDTKPSKGDIVVLLIGGGLVPVNPPVGFTTIQEQTAAGTYTTKGKLCYKFMGDIPDTQITIVGGTQDTAVGGSISIVVFRNVNNIVPLDVSTVYSTAINTVKPNPPSITPITTGSYIISCGVGRHTKDAVTFTSSDLTNFISSTGNDDYDCTSGIGYKEWVSGAFDTAQFGFTGVDTIDYSSVGYSMVLRPKQ